MEKNANANPFGIRLSVVFTETKDAERLADFYGQILGLAIRKQFGDLWIEYQLGGASRAIHRVGPSDDDRTFLSFEVSDLEGLRSHLIGAGVTCSEIQVRDRGRFFTCRDPSGTPLHFISFDLDWRGAHSY